MEFSNYINSKHPTMKLTVELEKDNCLPFLDCLVHKNNIFNTSVYRKPTFSGLSMSYFRFVPFNLKINSFKTLTH